MNSRRNTQVPRAPPHCLHCVHAPGEPDGQDEGPSSRDEIYTSSLRTQTAACSLLVFKAMLGRGRRSCHFFMHAFKCLLNAFSVGSVSTSFRRLEPCFPSLSPGSSRTPFQIFVSLSLFAYPAALPTADRRWPSYWPEAREKASDSGPCPCCSPAPGVSRTRSAAGSHRPTGGNHSDFTGGETEARGRVVTEGAHGPREQWAQGGSPPSSLQHQES